LQAHDAERRRALSFRTSEVMSEIASTVDHAAQADSITLGKRLIKDRIVEDVYAPRAATIAGLWVHKRMLGRPVYCLKEPRNDEVRNFGRSLPCRVLPDTGEIVIRRS